MKLRAKIFIIVTLTWISFLAITYAHAVRYSFVIYSILTILFSLITIWLLNITMLKRIENLNQKITKVNHNNILDKKNISFESKDEITSVTDEFNKILMANQQKEQETKNTAEQLIKELRESNDLLHKETVKRKFFEGKISLERDRVTQLAHYDNVTSLPNRIFFNEILNKTMSHSKRHRKNLAILFISLDSFDFNENSTNNNSLLKEMGTRFLNTLRSEDILAKSDGGDFYILLTDIGKPKFASIVAEKLLKVCSKPLTKENHQASFTASIGICIYPNDGDSLEALLNNANSALENVKNQGGNNYQFYTKEIDVEAREHIELTDALRHAIANNELTLYYQPKLNIKEGNIAGLEALIRWSHPKFGVINPEKIILLAEETGLIMALGEWILREACETNKHWQNEGYEYVIVAINLAAKQFYDPNLPQLIKNILEETKINANYLEIEITETIIMTNVELASEILNNIKNTGVLISIDHFGMGYTSISHLKKFPLSALKIDQSFIKGIPHNPNDIAITNAFITLAHNFGLGVVAEGVETAEQVQYLAEKQCDMVQGYFLSHPLPAAKITLQLNKISEKVLI